MSRSGMFLLALAILFPAVATAEPELRTVPSEDKISVNFSNVTLADAAKEIQKRTGFRCSVAPDVANVRITLNIRDIGPNALIRLLARQAGLNTPGIAVAKHGDTYEIVRQPLLQRNAEAGPLLEADPRLAQKVDVNFDKTPLREALRTLLETRGVKYEIEKEVPELPIRLKATGQTVDTLVRRLFFLAIDQMPELRLSRSLGSYRITREPRPPASDELQQALAQKATVHVKEVPLRAAIERIMSGSGLQYAISPNVPNLSISLDLEARPIRDCLRALVQTVRDRAPRLAVVYTGEVVIIEQRGPLDNPRQP